MAHDHDHSHGQSVNEMRLGIAAALTGGFMIVEAVGGVLSGSLALLADAGHMLTDSAALFLAWLALRIARRPATWQRTYGFDRLSVLAAFVNGLALFLIALWIIIEAIERFSAPVDVMGQTMLIIAVAGLVVNILAFWVLYGADRKNLNIRAAALHVIGDLLGSVGAILAAIIILTTGWYYADPLLSVLVAILILRGAWVIVKEASHILLEGAPSEIDTRAVAKDLLDSVEGVEDVHHLHAWSITQDRPMMTLHAKIGLASDAEAIIVLIKKRLHDTHGIAHATVEIERRECSDEVIAAT